MTSLRDLLKTTDKQHLLLLYDEENERSSAEIGCINRALAEGQYCVYATVDANDSDFEAKLAPRIKDYDRHIGQGDLRIVNFEPFYESAAHGELAPFRQLKAQVESTLKERTATCKSGKALLVADAACNMSRHRQFDECVTLESWWQDTYIEWMAKKLDITIICAHPSSVLKLESALKERDRISHLHSLMLDLKDFNGMVSESESKLIRILIAEPDPDIRTVYARYLKSLPLEVETVDGGRECLEKALLDANGRSYDMIIIDTHVKDANGLHIAKKILEEKPLQEIVFTTTWDIETLRSDFSGYSIDMKKYPVIRKPFTFSHLLEHIKPAKYKMGS